MEGVDNSIGSIGGVGDHRLPETALVESENSKRARYNLNSGGRAGGATKSHRYRCLAYRNCGRQNGGNLLIAGVENDGLTLSATGRDGYHGARQHGGQGEYTGSRGCSGRPKSFSGNDEN